MKYQWYSMVDRGYLWLKISWLIVVDIMVDDQINKHQQASLIQFNGIQWLMIQSTMKRFMVKLCR